MKNDFVAEFRKKGEQADNLADSGKFKEAIDLYHSIIKELGKNPDGFFLAKATLGLLRTLTNSGQFRQAFDIWNSEDNAFAKGISSIENAQVAVPDLIVYDMICAHLHTMRNSAPEGIARAVTQYMSRVCEHAEEQGDRALMYMAINNWKHHLKAIFDATIPFEWAKPLIAFEKTLGDQVKLRPISFPRLDSWEPLIDPAAETVTQARKPAPEAPGNGKPKTGTR